MKNLLYMLGGAVVGAGVTYTLLRKYYNETIIPEIREDYKERLNQELEKAGVMSEYKDAAEEYKVKDSEDDNQFAGKAHCRIKKPDVKEEEKVDYTSYSAKTPEVDTEAEDKKIDAAKAKNKKIYCISEDDFLELNGCDKVTLTYFQEDDVFMDETEQSVDNGLKLIGRAQLKEIDKYEGNVLYVHNTSNDTDYEVIFEEGSYADYVEGN